MTSQRYEVLRDDRVVLSFTDEPGVLLSSAAPPVDFKPPAHPFINARARDAFSEARLAELLAQAHSASQFIALLIQDGFAVRSVEA